MSIVTEMYNEGYEDGKKVGKIEILNELKNAVKGHKYVNAEDGAKIDECSTSMSGEFEKQYQYELTVNVTCNWVLNVIDNLEKNIDK